MGKYIIEPDQSTEIALGEYASRHGITCEEAVVKILNAALDLAHTMYGEAESNDLAGGYGEWSEVNLEWANLGFKE